MSEEYVIKTVFSCALIIFLTFASMIVVPAKKQYNKEFNLYRYMLFCYFILILTASWGAYVYTGARSQPIKEANRILENSGSIIRINGKRMHDIDNLKMSLLNSRNYRLKSGSGPRGKSYFIEASYNGKLVKLRFVQDSRDDNLYWVFYPKYKYMSAIAFVETSVLLHNEKVVAD